LITKPTLCRNRVVPEFFGNRAGIPQAKSVLATPEQEQADFFIESRPSPAIAGEGFSFFTGGEMERMGRRAFGAKVFERMLVFTMANLLLTITSACGGSPTQPSPPSSPNPVPQPPTNPVLNLEQVIFSFDKSLGQRIGGERTAGVYGTLRDVMTNAKINFEDARSTGGERLVTMFDSVRPPSKYGIVFLIKGTRFTTNIDGARLNGNVDTWAAYEWKGAGSAPSLTVL
jgi:hypothetical protein